jgi:hypothetical protein
MSNEKFKVKFGLAVGDTAATIDATTGEGVFAEGDNGQITVGAGVGDNGRIEIGLTGRTVAGTPYIDFHSSASSVDYDVRMLASGPTTPTGDGEGTLTITAANTINSGDLAVNGGDITTTQTTASVFNTTATTVNVSGAATTTNIGAKTGSSIINGTNRYTSPVIYALAGATNHRGLMISNGNASSAASARNAIVMRTFPVTGGARGGIFFENARGTETTPTAIQNNDLIGESSVTGYATNNYVANLVSATPGAAFFVATENWADNGAGTVTNAGTGYQIACYPTATNMGGANANRITILNANPQTFATRSDSFSWSKGKTNATSMATLADDGTGKTTFSVNKLDATTGSEYALINFNTQRSSGGTYSPTQSGDYLGQFKFNGNALSGGSPGGTTGPGVSIDAQATETWTTLAQGTSVIFTAIKTGATTGIQVINASPNATTFKSDAYTFDNSSGTDYAVIDANTAKFNVPVTTEITTTTISEGTTYTPAATVDNNISVQIDTLAGGTTVIDLINLTGNTRGASYNILVFNNTASGTPIQVKNTRINTNNLTTHTITTGSPRIIINAYVVGDYATATHLVVA